MFINLRWTRFDKSKMKTQAQRKASDDDRSSFITNNVSSSYWFLIITIMYTETRLITPPSLHPLPSSYTESLQPPNLETHKECRYQNIFINVQVDWTWRFVHTTFKTYPPPIVFKSCSPHDSFIVQQWLSLPVSADDITFFPELQLLPESPRNCDDQSGDK